MIITREERPIKQRSTGFKDMWGNIMREGDIVKWNDRSYLVVYIKEGSEFKFKSTSGYFYNLSNNHEIVGSIHDKEADK